MTLLYGKIRNISCETCKHNYRRTGKPCEYSYALCLDKQGRSKEEFPPGLKKKNTSYHYFKWEPAWHENYFPDELFDI